MTGRSWRHFSVFWPFMVAGLVGRANAVEPLPATVDGNPVAPTGHLPRTLASMGISGGETSSDDSSDALSASSCPSVNSFDDGCRVARSDDLAMTDDAGGVLPDERLDRSSAYQEFFSQMAVHDAYLELFCQVARLGGMLFGDNVADETSMTEAAVEHMDEAAKVLGVDSIQTLYGHVNTTKLHRLVAHLGDELRARGNLWEGDTSVNEKLHGSCKRMFKRSNKRGPGVALQMMRCEETQSAVLRELCDADLDDNGSTGSSGSTRVGSDTDGSHEGGATNGTNVANDGAASRSRAPVGACPSTGTLPPPLHTERLSFTGRGQRMAIGDLRRIPALASVGGVLGMSDDD